MPLTIVGQRQLLLVAAQPRYQHGPPGLDVTRTELDPDRDALQLPLGELVARPMLIAVVEPDADARAARSTRSASATGVDGRAFFIGAVDRHDHDLHRCDGRRQAQSGVVAVGHDRRADHARAEAPRGAPGVLLLAAGVRGR